MILIVGSTVLLGWVIKHSEPSSSVGLRDIHQAEQIDRGAWHDGLSRGIDHPLHPVLIVAAHHLVGGEGPGSWQRAALVLCFSCGVLLVIPIYLLTLEVFGSETAWLACLVTIANPIMGSIVLNVLSESTFLLWWTFGLWAAVRFLREGRFLWLPLAIGFGALAYLTRPEGMLLPLALAASLLILPVLRATRINWPRWWRALAFLAGGLVFLVGPYIALKGGLGTKPPIAQVLGLAPEAQPLALEREAPLPPGRTAIETYKVATTRVLEIFRDAVTLPLLPFALVGIVMAGRNAARARAALFLAIVLAASAVALVRLHATAGYCTPRHALVPAMLLSLAAAHAITEIVRKISVPGRWLGVANERLRPGPAVWAVLLALLVVVPSSRHLGPMQSRPLLRLPPHGRMARSEHARQRASARPDRLVALFQSPDRLQLRRPLQGACGPSHALDRRSSGTDGRSGALLPGDTRVDRRPPTGRAVAAGGDFPSNEDSNLRPPGTGDANSRRRDRGRR